MSRILEQMTTNQEVIESIASEEHSSDLYGYTRILLNQCIEDLEDCVFNCCDKKDVEEIKVHKRYIRNTKKILKQLDNL